MFVIDDLFIECKDYILAYNLNFHLKTFREKLVDSRANFKHFDKSLDLIAKENLKNSEIQKKKIKNHFQPICDGKCDCELISPSMYYNENEEDIESDRDSQTKSSGSLFEEYFDTGWFCIILDFA